MTTVDFTNEEFSAIVTQLGAGINELAIAANELAKNGNIQRAKELEDFLKPIVSGYKKMASGTAELTEEELKAAITQIKARIYSLEAMQKEREEKGETNIVALIGDTFLKPTVSGYEKMVRLLEIK